MNEDYLMHYGVGHLQGGNSGRWPWGYGDNPYQRAYNFMAEWRDLREQGLSESEAAESLHMTRSEAAQIRAISIEELDMAKDRRILEMTKNGMTPTQIGREMGVNESTIRNRLKIIENPKKASIHNIADALRHELETKKAIDIGAGVEKELGVTKERLDAAIKLLEAEGYNYYPDQIRMQQATAGVGKKTTMRALANPDVTTSDIYKDPLILEPVRDYHSDDNGASFNRREYPASIDSSRVFIRYGDEGGKYKDGTIEIRPGVPDLSLGKSTYAQVRIAVDDKQYMKGMAFYSNDVPEGYDCVYNVHYNRGEKIFKSFKKTISGEVDRDNPFGAYIKAEGQSWYDDPKTGEKKLSAINKLKEEGDWDQQSRTLASQFLAKQPIDLVKTQLKATIDKAKSDLEDIRKIENPTIRKQMLLDYAGENDEAAEELKAIALPRQSTKVILPLTCMKDNEIYAPTYETGEKVVLVRYPHAGTFEIPELIVNNNRKEARSTIGQAKDAVGINISVAEKLSGADFDGDTVMVIPVNDKIRIKSRDRLEGLKDFEPKEKYYTGKGEGSTMSERDKGMQMGLVSNLITDMTIKGAPDSDIEKAVKHSMVVIDAYKHGLDWKQSEIDNDIQQLKAKWQAESPKHGASTLLSRASSEYQRPETELFQPYRDIDKDTGKVILRPTGRTYEETKEIKDSNGKVIGYEKTGKRKVAMEKTSKMANELATKGTSKGLSSGELVEEVYSLYADARYALANTARKEYLSIKDYKVNDSARIAYADEVDSLTRKLNLALMQAPKERQAQRIAKVKIKAILEDHPELKQTEYKEKLGKYKNQALNDARNAVGASKKDYRIDVTDKEWEAIQSKAISASTLNKIMRNMDSEKLIKRVMPNDSPTISVTKQNMIKAYAARGYTQEEIADALNISTSTVNKYK